MEIKLDYYTLLREVHSYAAMQDVGVQLVRLENPEEEERFVPFASMDKQGKRQIVLLQPEPWWDAERVVDWRADFYHELGHFAPEVMDDYTIAKEKGMNHESLLGLGYNCVSDYRQEKNNIGMYAGRDEVLSKGMAIGVQNLIDKFQDGELEAIEANSDKGILSALQVWSVIARENWQRDLAGMGDALKNKFNPEIQAQADRLHAEYTDQLDACTNAEQLYDLWTEVLETVFERDKNEEEQKAKQAAQQAAAEGDGFDGDGEGDGATGEGSGVDRGDKAGKESEGGGDGGSERRKKAAKVHWKDLSMHEHDTKGASYESLTINYEGYRGDGQFACATPDKLDVRNYEKNTGNVIARPDSSYHRGLQGQSSHTGLSNKIRKLLQVKTQTLRVNGQKKGKLSAKNIHRATMNGDAGSYRERVFNKTVQRYNLDTAVSIVTDFSGSMGGDKMRHAIMSTMMLNEAIGRIGVPIEVLGFTEDSDTGIINVLKSYDKPVTNDVLLERMCRAAGEMGSNADGEAILYAYDRLLKQPNKRKLMIVLSDGQPASYRGDVYTFTKETIKNIEKDGRVEIYGIGIEDNSVREFYKHNQTIRNSSELESAVLNVVKNHIIK